MIETSEKYKELIARPIRNACHLKVQFSLVEPSAPDSSTLSDNGHEYFSDLDKTELGFDLPTKQYGTFEDYFWVLNDSQEIPRPRDVEQLYQGFVGNKLSDEKGVYNEPSIITIDYDDYLNMAGLVLTFDELSGDYPTEINFKTFNKVNDDYEIVEDFTLENDSTTLIIERNFELHQRIQITPLKSNKPYRRFRLMEIVYGITKIYDTSNFKNKSNIISADEHKEISLVNKNLPTNEFSFSVNNISGEFDTDNPNGVYKYFTERQPITYWWGIEDDNGQIEWLLGGKMFTTSEFQSDFTKVTINCSDALSLLNDTYTRGLYRPNGISLYDLALEVLEWGDMLTNDSGDILYDLDESLKEIYTIAPLPKESGKACLQLIATAGGCILYTDRNGILCMKKQSNDNTGYRADFNMFLSEPPRTNQVSLVKTITSEYYTYSTSNTDSRELAKLETTLNGTETLVIEYSNGFDVSATITGGTIDNAIYYTNSCELTVTANGAITIIVNGKELQSTSTKVEKNINEIGINTSYTNPLITTYEDCNNMIDFVTRAVENRNVYEGDFVGDPSLDVGDLINTQTKFTNSLDSIITGTEINYQGSFNGKLKFLKKDL